MTPSNKVKPKSGNKVFQDIADKVAQISAANPATKSSYLEEIEKARQAREKAIQKKEEAETGEDLDQALEAERIAKQKESFFKKKLEIMDFTPRIPEEEYDGYIQTIDGVMQKAAADFKDKARKAMEMLVDARDSYFQLAEEADNILEDLDRASNVLQSKYRYRKTEYQGMDPVYQEDLNEWFCHRIRYASCVNGTAKGSDMIRKDNPENWKDGNPWDRTACVALDAANKIRPQR